VGNGLFFTIGNNYNFSLLPPGTYKITGIHRALGTRTYKDIVITADQPTTLDINFIDNTKPVITAFLISDANTANKEYTTNRKVQVEMEGYDDSGTVWRYLITETPETPTVEQMLLGDENPYTSYDIHSPDDGQKALYAWVMDGSNNISIGSSVTILLDTATTLTIDTITSPTYINYQTMGGQKEEGALIDVNCSTAAIGAVNYPSETTWSVVLSDLNLGNNEITVISTDQYNNQNKGLPDTCNSQRKCFRLLPA